MEEIIRKAIEEYMENHALDFSMAGCPSITEDTGEVAAKMAQHVTDRVKTAGGRMD